MELRVFSEAWALLRVTRLFPDHFVLEFNASGQSYTVRSSDRYNIWQFVHLCYVDGAVRYRETTDILLHDNEVRQAGGVVQGTRLILPEEHSSRASERPTTREKVD